ncbi:hypothetical protein [Flindersiella endophytica]
MDRSNGRLRRLAPPVGLVLLAPLVAEFLMGNITLTYLIALPLIALLYGGGALLIREYARRTGRGWPTMLGLALAYGMLEETFVTQTLFNQNWAGFRILDYGYVSGLGLGLPWTLFMVGVHTVWSISVPIALAETIARERRTTPWLGKVGFGVTAVLFTLTIVGDSILTATREGVASVTQLVVAAVIVAVIATIALRLPRPGRLQPAAGRVPSPWLACGFAAAAGAAFVLLYAADPTGLSPWLAALRIPAWVNVVANLALFAITITVVTRWSRRPDWSQAHILALAGGALLTYAWHSFPWRSLDDAGLVLDLASNTVFTAGAIALLAYAARRVSEPHSLTPTH